VLLNLIANATDSMAGEDEPRILSVKSGVQDSGIMVAVADSGKGIASQDVGRIFSPLFTTKSDGMGMGLSICRSIIEAHDGRLWVAGNTPRGAVFQFVLPVAAARDGVPLLRSPDHDEIIEIASNESLQERWAANGEARYE
jgi:C4-dicarboxylate-specific signal transduction histidine kinase